MKRLKRKNNCLFENILSRLTSSETQHVNYLNILFL